MDRYLSRSTCISGRGEHYVANNQSWWPLGLSWHCRHCIFLWRYSTVRHNYLALFFFFYFIFFFFLFFFFFYQILLQLSVLRWLFGGVRTAGGLMSDVWHYSLNNRAWRFVKGPTTPDTTATGGPAPRFFSHGWLSPDTSELIIFGGSMMADTWKFNYLTRRWYNRPYAFTPSPRLGGCTFRDGNTLYLFGGQGPYPNDYNDLWAYNGEKSGWTMILRAASEFPANPPQTNVFYNASRPSVRARVNCHQVPGSRLVYMYSGATWEGTYFSDVWVFSLDLLQWARVNAFATTSTYSPLGVGSSTSASASSFFFFFFFFFFFLGG
jgi:hypothetical protein